MSADFEKVLIKDPRLDVSDSIKYGVIKGGQNMTASPFNAISASNSQLVFNIQVPSEQTIIDRRVLLQTELNLELNFIDPQGWFAWAPSLTATGNTAIVAPVSGTQLGGATGSCYGTLSALAPFPLHQLMTVMNATINNNTVSLNIRDVLPAMIRMLDLEDLVQWNNSAPTYPDPLASYATSYGNLSNPHASYWNTADPRMIHRGCYVPTRVGFRSIAATGNVVPVNGVPAISPAIINERWSWLITEPLLLSPFIFAHLKCNGQGFYGIQNLNFVFNIGDTSRVFRGFAGSSAQGPNPASYSYNNPSPALGFGGSGGSLPYLSCRLGNNNVLTNNVTPTPGTQVVADGVIAGWSDGTTSLFTLGKTRLLFNFLTPHPSDLMPARNIVPFYELPRYISAGGDVSAAVNQAALVGAGYTNPQGAQLTPGTGLLQTNSLQLNQIPDKLIIFVRKLASNQSYGDPDVALPINNISINFNNMSGILASASQVQLFQMTRENGCSSNYLDFTGAAMSTRQGVIAYNGQGVPPYTGVQNNVTAVNALYGATGGPGNAATTLSQNTYIQQVVATSGSYLCLEFGKDIQLTEDFYAPGSLGNFNLQVQIGVNNYNGYGYDSSNPCEIVLITMNSGVFVCERGTSSTYTGILTKQDVLEASQQDHYTHDDVNRMVGGGFFGRILSSAASAARNLGSQAMDAAKTHGQQFVQGQIEKHAPALRATAERHLGNVRNQAEGAISGAVGRVTGAPSSSRRRSRRSGRGLEEHY